MNFFDTNLITPQKKNNKNKHSKNIFRVSTTPGNLLEFENKSFLEIWNFIDAPGKFNHLLKYDNMPLTERNLVTSLNPRNCHLTIFLCSFVHTVVHN